jgi:hypothetical protein
MASELATAAPTGARLVVLMRSDRIRHTAYRDSAEQILEMLPDYWGLLGQAGGRRAVDAFDDLLVATANPLDLTETFLVARYHVSESKARALLDKGSALPITWTTYRGVGLGKRPPGRFDDPRVILTPAPGLMVLTRPEFVDDLLDGLAPASAPASDPAAQGDDPASGPASSPAGSSSAQGATSEPVVGASSAPASAPTTWIGRLEELEKESGGASPDGPLVLVTASNLPELLDMTDDDEVPLTLSLGLRDPATAALAAASQPTDAVPDPADGDDDDDDDSSQDAPVDPSDLMAQTIVLDAVLTFHTPSDAERFASDTWPAMMAIVKSEPLAGMVMGDLNRLQPVPHESEVRFHAEVPGPDVAVILSVARMAMPTPPTAAVQWKAQ